MSIFYPNLHLQWHLTVECEHRCEHCYIYDDETYENEIKNQLRYEDCVKIIDDFAYTLRRLPAAGNIHFTGGDPLLRKDLFDILRYTEDKGISIGIMGNADHIDYEMAQRLRSHGVNYFQMSIDGMEELHDKLRSPGSFQNTFRAAKLLQRVGMWVNIMNTLRSHNASDLLPIMRRIGEEGINSFSFTRLAAVGAGSKYEDELIDPREYREIYLNYFKEAARLGKKGIKTHYIRKDHLWLPLFLEEGWLRGIPEVSDNFIYGGCGLGVIGLIILADGSVSACRRFPNIIGKMPQQSFSEIFFHSKELNEMRDISNYEKCSKCELARFCRGCPATACGASGSVFAPDPQCWKEI